MASGPDLRLAVSQSFIMTNRAHPEIAGQDTATGWLGMLLGPLSIGA
jgi:hypothetical protein